MRKKEFDFTECVAHTDYRRMDAKKRRGEFVVKRLSSQATKRAISGCATKMRRGTSDSERRTIINGNRVFRFDCERCRLEDSEQRVNATAYSFNANCPKRGAAFTLAEVLITLGIIGVVAALTLPSVIEKHQKHVTVSKLKKVYSTLSQFVVKTYADNGPASDFLSSGEVVSENKTKEFFETYWLPYFNGAKAGNFYKDGSSGPYHRIDGTNLGISVITNYTIGRILFSVQDGTIYHVWVMGWDVEKDENGNKISQTALYKTQQEVFVDINGIKPPNRLGKDVFKFYVDFNSNIAKPQCNGFTMQQINNNCKKGSNGGECCAAKIIKDGWQIKDDYPW